MSATLSVIEIFRSIQGETSFAGLPCGFVRLAGCNLRCSYCDTGYAWEESGEELSVEQVAEKLHQMGVELICITGGEPLLQNATPQLAENLLRLGHGVLVETNGTQDISALPKGTIRIMDVKCPGSGECGETLLANLGALTAEDEVKFVLTGRGDFEWAAHFARHHRLLDRCKVLFSPAYGLLTGAQLAEWILDSGLNVRLQLQLHRILWPERNRGV
jgi:7-carboxy-7-deazaguanine synthase